MGRSGHRAERPSPGGQCGCASLSPPDGTLGSGAFPDDQASERWGLGHDLKDVAGGLVYDYEGDRVVEDLKAPAWISGHMRLRPLL